MSGNGGGRSGALLALTVILLLAAALRFVTLLHHRQVNYDEGRYLDNAVHLMEGDGLYTSTLSHYIGEPPRPPRPEDFSSPLYPYGLAALFRLTGPSFAAARTLSLLLSVAAVGMTFALGHVLFGPGVGLAAAAGMALQADQAIVGSWAMTEPVYTVLLLGFLIPFGRLLKDRDGPRRISWRAAAGLGLLLGLLFLCRQNGAAVAVSAAALLVLLPTAPGEGRGRRAGLVLLMAVVAFLVCLPWFVRNAREFGSPTFSRQENVSWAEHGRSLYTLQEEPPSLQRYLREHRTGGVLASLVHRARRVTRAALFAERGPFRWLTLLGVVSILLPALRRRAAVLLVPCALSMALLLGVAPWSGALPRYMMPLRPALYVAGAAAAAALWRSLVARRLPEPGRLAAAGVAVALLLGWGALVERPVYGAYLERDQAAADCLARDASAWIAGNTGPEEVLMEGGFLHQYAYLYRRAVIWVPYGDFEDARGVAARYGARYLVISRSVLRFRPDLAGHWETAGDALVEKDVPAGLVRVLDWGERGLLIYAFVEEGSR